VKTQIWIAVSVYVLVAIAPVRQEEATHAAPSSAVHPPREAHPDTGHLSQSERDWAYAKRALARGVPPSQIVADIARFRQDKPNPRYYAERTAARAAADLAISRESDSSFATRSPDR
jgi:hypothetical protein